MEGYIKYSKSFSNRVISYLKILFVYEKKKFLVGLILMN